MATFVMGMGRDWWNVLLDGNQWQIPMQRMPGPPGQEAFRTACYKQARLRGQRVRVWYAPWKLTDLIVQAYDSLAPRPNEPDPALARVMRLTGLHKPHPWAGCDCDPIHAPECSGEVVKELRMQEMLTDLESRCSCGHEPHSTTCKVWG